MLCVPCRGQPRSLRPHQSERSLENGRGGLCVSVCLQPFQHQLLVSLPIPCVGPDAVRHNHQRSLVSAGVLVLEESSDIVSDRRVGEFRQTHAHKPIKDHIVRRQPLRHRIPIILDIFPQQVPHVGVCCQGYSSVVDILDRNLIREDKVQIVLDKLWVLGTAKRCQADFLAVDRVSPEVFFLNCLILLATSFPDVDAEDGRSEVGVDGITVLACSPQLEAPLGLRNNASIMSVVLHEKTTAQRSRLAFHVPRCLPVKAAASEVDR